MPVPWTSDDELFALARRQLYSAVIGDVLDRMGRQHQFLPPAIAPLHDAMVLAGRAMPVLQADLEGPEDPANPFGLMLRALDDLAPGDVYVCTGGTRVYASWGELMSTCAANRGAAGVVVDGWSRDTRGVLEAGLPCFARGRYAQDQRSRGTVVDFRCAVRIGDVDIRPGDIIFGDLDGVVVVPRELEQEAFAAALQKAHGERHVFDAIKGGMGAQDAWRRYGVF